MAVTDFTPIVDARPDDTVWRPMSWPPPADVRLAGRVVEMRLADASRDGAELFAALDDARVWAHMPVTRPDIGGFMEFLVSRRAAGMWTWTVRLRAPVAGLAAGAVVGMSSYLDVSVRDARLEIGATAYRPEVWATAVNPDTKLLLLGYAFDELGAGRVQLKTDVRNVRAQRAIARLGARYEGTLGRYQRRADGTVRDTVLFAVLAEDWPAVAAGLRAGLEA